MKRQVTFLLALLLTWIGANAQTDYSSKISNAQADWTNATGTYASTAVERYQTSAFETGKVLYQEIVGLTPGTYSVTFYAVASYTSGRGFTAGYGDNIAQAFANNTTTSVKVEDVGDSGVTPSEHSYTLSCTVGANGILEYGLQNIASGGNWYVCQGVSLYLTEASTVTLQPGEVIDDEGEEDHLNHWSQTFTGTSENGALGYNTWSGESGMTIPYQQVWVNAGSSTSPAYLSDQTISHYQFMGLPAGYYAVTVDARVLSELDIAIAEKSAYFTANGQSVDLVELASTDEDFTYGTATEHEVNGSYDIIAEVTESDGTLDIGFSVTSATYNWISWKNLKVEYIGTTIDYSLGEPECSATTVKPGEELTITFEDCITPNTDETPVLDSSKSITVNGNAVAAELTTTGLTASVAITIPDDIALGSTVTVVVPAGLLTWANSNPAVSSPTSDVTFTFSTPGMEDQIGVYLYNVHADQFLSRGGETSGDPTTYGEIAATDVYGIPLDITFGDDGFATVKFLDSNNYLYLEGWAYTDGSEANAAKYEVRTVTTTEGETVYQFCYNGNDEYLYVNDETNNYVASNGNLGDNGGDNNMNSQPERGYWQIFTANERNAHKAARELNDHIVIAAADGATVTTEAEFEAYLESIGATTDMTDMVANADLTSLTGWTSVTYSGSAVNTDTYGTEIYETDAKISQTVTGLEQGIYKVTMQGFVRQGSAANIINNNLGVYDLSIGFLEANGYQTNIMPWAEDREKVTGVTLTDSYPDNTGEATTCFSQGLYMNELYTYVDSDGSLELSINCPDALGAGWMIMTNITLTWYGELEDVDSDYHTGDVIEAQDGKSYKVLSDNIVPNHSFELGFEGWTSANDFTSEITATYFKLVNTDSDSDQVSGDRYLVGTGWGGSSSDRSLGTAWPIEEGKTYYFSYNVKNLSNATETDYLISSLTNTPGTETKELGHPETVSADWQTVEYVFDSDSYAYVQIKFRWLATEAGVEQWGFDNFQIYEVEEAEIIEWEMTDAGWGTLILPFDAEIPTATDDNVEATLTLYAGSALTVDGSTITVGEAADALVANTPYLVKGTAGTYTFAGVPTNEEDAYTDGMLTGTLVDLSQAEGTLSDDGSQYVLQNHNEEGGDGLAFYPITDESTGVTLEAYHCYLTGVTATALHLPGMATGIVAVESDDVIANGAIYDLSGRRVSKAVKGVYIQNGKKVLVK